MATTCNAAEIQYDPTVYFTTEVYGHVTRGDEQKIKDGVFAVDRIYEHFEAKMYNTTILSIKGIDLANKANCKYRTTYYGDASVRAKDTYGFKNMYVAIYDQESSTLTRFNIPRATECRNGYTPGKGLFFHFSIKGKGYGKWEEFVISRVQL